MQFHIIALKDANDNKGPGYWKFNVKHLFKAEFRQLVKTIIEEVTDTLREGNVQEKWEFFKMKLRGEIIKFWARKKKSNINKLEALENKLYQLAKEGDNAGASLQSIKLFEEQENQMTLIQKDIEHIIEEKSLKARQRSSANWHAYGGKNSRYFFALENKYPKRPLSRIQVGSEIVDDGEIILSQLECFYQKLFTTNKDIGEEEFLTGLNFPQVKEEHYRMLEQPISMAEVKIVVNQLKKGKCPGIDGFGREIYQEMFDDLKFFLHSLLMDIVNKKKLNDSARKGLISLLEKTGKDQLFIDNWRPLTLLCSDYKIYAKILADQLAVVTEYLIHPDQYGFLRNRFIF